MTYNITLSENGESFACNESENVLESMFRLGKKGIPSGCRGGGCGVCKVKVLGGGYSVKKMSSCHISNDELENDVVLACRVFPESDLQIAVTGLMKKNALK